MADMDSQYGGRWRYRESIESNSYTISSSSGTISTAYTSATDSQMSTHLDGVVWEQIVDKKGHVKGLAQEFFAGNGSINGAGDIRVLERWFTELGVGWVLRLAAGEFDHTPTNAARSWISALTEITSSMSEVFVDDFWETVGFIFMNLSILEEEQDVTESETLVDSITVRVQFARFIQEAMLRMSSFVDFIVALNPTVYGMPGLYEKLNALLEMHGAPCPLWASRSLVPSELKRVHGEMVSLSSEKNGKVHEAIWTTMEEIWTRIRQPMEDDDSSWRDPQASLGIHKFTESLTSYIELLYPHKRSVTQIVSKAVRHGNYVTRIANNDPFANLIMDMTSILEEKVAQKSLLFPDQSLRFLFLLNNSYFIWKKLEETPVLVGASLRSKIERYIQSYLQESWAPILSCLSCTTMSCTTTLFLGRYTPLCKFESEFMRTYTTQKLWKVPDPMMRGRLRKAIVERVAPGYRKYLEDNSITTPRITSQELEEMLQELFEG